MLRRHTTAVLTVALALAALAFAPGTAKAFHIGGTLDCGTAGTFTTEGTDFLSADFQAPPGSSVRLLLNTTQVFTILAASRDGVVVFGNPGLEHSNANIVTCQQQIETIGTFTFIGVLTGPGS